MFGSQSQGQSTIDGFGSLGLTQTEMSDFAKALEVGAEINPPGSVVPGDGFALRVESLERVLRTTTYKMKDVKLYKMLTKRPAFNTVEEFNLVKQYAQGGIPGFFAESGLPNTTDASYERKHVKVKFVGTTRVVSHVATLVRPAHGSVTSQETVNGTMELLRIIERALFRGDSSVEALEFDGYEKQIIDGAPAENVIDLRGGVLNEDVISDGALTVSDLPNVGIPTDLYCNPKNKADFIKGFYPRQRGVFPINNGVVGADVAAMTTQAGDVRIHSDVFIDDGGAPLAAATGDAALRPAAPTFTVQPAGSGTGDGTKFTADDIGGYFYRVVAVNESGKAAAVDSNVVNLTTVGETVTMTIDSNNTPLATHFELYRTPKDGAVGTARLIQRVANGGATTVFTDENEDLPGTNKAYLFQGDTENMTLAQLAPMLKVPLATLALAIRWAQVTYLVPILYTPGKNVVFKNVGRVAGFAGAP